MTPIRWYSPTRFSKKLVLPSREMCSMKSKGFSTLYNWKTNQTLVLTHLSYTSNWNSWINHLCHFRVKMIKTTNVCSYGWLSNVYGDRSGSTLAQVMACYLPDGNKPLPEPMWTHQRCACSGIHLCNFTRNYELIHVIAWCRQATGHYPSECWPRSVSPYGVTRPRVKSDAEQFLITRG